MRKQLFFVLFLFLFASVTAQIPIYGNVSGTCSKPCYSLYYAEWTSTHIPTWESHPSFPDWEVWKSYEGVRYVVFKRKQHFDIFEFLGLKYNHSDCTILMLTDSQ